MTETIDDIIREVSNLDITAPNIDTYEGVTDYLVRLVEKSVSLSDRIYTCAVECLKKERYDDLPVVTKSYFIKGASIKDVSHKSPALFRTFPDNITISWRGARDLSSFEWCPRDPRPNALYPRITPRPSGEFLIEFCVLADKQIKFHNDRFPAILLLREGKVLKTKYYLYGKEVYFWELYEKASAINKKILLRDWLPLVAEDLHG